MVQLDGNSHWCFLFEPGQDKQSIHIFNMTLNERFINVKSCFFLFFFQSESLVPGMWIGPVPTAAYTCMLEALFMQWNGTVASRWLYSIITCNSTAACHFSHVYVIWVKNENAIIQLSILKYGSFELNTVIYYAHHAKVNICTTHVNCYANTTIIIFRFISSPEITAWKPALSSLCSSTQEERASLSVSWMYWIPLHLGMCHWKKTEVWLFGPKISSWSWNWANKELQKITDGFINELFRCCWFIWTGLTVFSCFVPS